ncbi:MAG: DNA polymerase [Magnetococcus sp. WYHC-3]
MTLQLDGLSDNIYAVDTETTGLNYWEGDRPFLITISDWFGNVALARLGALQKAGSDAVDAPLTGSNGAAGPGPAPQENVVRGQINALQTLDDVRAMLADPTIIKVCHNCKFDVQMLKHAGFEVNGVVHDTMIMARLLYPELPSIALKSLARLFLKANTKSESILRDYMKEHKITDYSKLPPEVLDEYALDDVRYTMALFRAFYPRICNNHLALYDNERQLADLVGRMESRGMLCDLQYAKEQATFCRNRQAEIQSRLNEINEGPINPDSPKQLGDLIFGKLKLHETLTNDQRRRFSRILRTPKGEWSTKREALRIYEHPVIHEIMDYRMFGKMAGPYFERFIELADKDGVLHPSFWQSGTRTGRFSSSTPSFQTIPSVTSGRLLDFDRDIIPNVRRCFITRPEFKMYAPDYSQIELRLASFYAGDKSMQNAFIMGRDIHDETTKAIFPDDWESVDKPGSVDKPKRTFCKMVNFGVLYGMGVGKLSADLGVPIQRATEFLARYFKTYPGLKQLMEQCVRDIAIQGYVRSVFGRYFRTEPSAAYKGLNYLIQGTAADVMKITMVRMDKKFQELGVNAHILNTVHDEIIFEVAEKDDTPELHKEVITVMSDWPQFAPVPITVGYKQIIDYWSNHREFDPRSV